MFKLRKRLMTRVLLFVLIGIMVLLYLLLYAISKVNLPPEATHGTQGIGAIKNLLGLPVAIPFAFSMLASFGSVLAVILTASSIGNEYNWRTIRTMLISSESRSKLLVAKLVTATVYILIGMVVGVIIGFLMSLFTTWLGHYAFDFSFFTGHYAWDQFVQYWRTFFVMIPYILMGFMFAIVGRSAMPGIALGIGVYFLESIITTFMILASGWIAQIPNYLLNANVNTITMMADLPSGLRGGFGAFETGSSPTPAHAFITLSIYSVAFLAIAFYLFRKRDVHG